MCPAPITPALVVNLPERVLCLDVLALYIRRIEPEDAGFLSILVHLPTVAGLVPRMRAFRRWRCAFLMAGEFTESLNGWESSPQRRRRSRSWMRRQLACANSSASPPEIGCGRQCALSLTSEATQFLDVFQPARDRVLAQVRDASDDHVAHR